MMAWRDLLAMRTVGARAAVAGVPWRLRLRDALVAPPHPNAYVAPRLRSLDALAFALRGYRVSWTVPHVVDLGTSLRPTTSRLVYEVRRWRDGERRWPADPVYVELPTLLPGEVHRAASWLQGARTVGWRFAWWQVRRELPWVMQRRNTSSRRK